MALLVFTHYRLAYDSIHQNRTRSFLTCLGIAIGVAAIILILSLMGSINNLIQTQISVAGSDLIVVRPSTQKDETASIIDELTSSDQYLSSNLTLSDVEAIDKLENISYVAPIAKSSLSISADRKDENDETYTSTISSASVIGTTSDLAEIQNLTIHAGSFLSDGSAGLNNSTDGKELYQAAIGHDLSLLLLGTTEPVGKTFELMGQRFIITGVVAETEDPINFNNIDFDNSLFINASVLNQITSGVQIQQINVKVNTVSNISETSEQIKSALSDLKSGDQNFSVLYGDDISHPADSLFMIISSMLTVVAGVSLIVGGIGVMNIMLVSVAERTREIGIRKAVGAAPGQILLQFLFESLILSSLGGLLGLILGYTCAFLLSIITPFAPYIDINILGITLLTSVSVGIIFGLYPAIKAAHKDPIDSLRYFR